MSIAIITRITRITGQDDIYLAQLLLDKGYTVYGTYRRTSSVNFWRIEELGIQNHANLHLVEYDLTDPRSPYGLARLYAHWMTVNYRESYGIFAPAAFCSIMKATLRGREFVTRKITDSVAKIKLGKLDCVGLGNIDAKRDWGFVKEYVEGMWRMLQADESDTFVLATNRTAGQCQDTFLIS